MSPPLRGLHELPSLLSSAHKELVKLVLVSSLSHSYAYGYIYQTEWQSLYSELLDRRIIVPLSLVINDYSRGSGPQKVLTKYLFN